MAGHPFPVLRDYEILAELGRGTLGTTYRARSQRTREIHAVKLITGASDELALRLKRDVRELARIEHPHIARVHALVADGSNLLLVSELIEGSDLLSALKPPVDASSDQIRRAMFSFAQLLEALAHLHGLDLIHRGVKPTNVRIGTDGNVKLTDCGISRVWTLAALECLQPDETVAGAYLAPEQLAGRPSDARIDLYQVGLLLYEALSGNRPQKGDTLLAKLRSRIRDNPLPLATGNARVGLCFAPLVERLLARSPGDRYASAADVLVKLREAWELLRRGETGTTASRRTASYVKPASTSVDPALLPDGLETTRKMRPFGAETAPEQRSERQTGPTTAAAADTLPVGRAAAPAPAFAPAPASATAAAGKQPAIPGLPTDREVTAALTRPMPEQAPSLAPALVGRAAELDLLEQALLATCGGRGELVAVAGEAGIGKSRLLEEFAAGARLGGAQVLAGRDDERKRARRGTIVTLLEAAARTLSAMSEAERAQCLPEDAAALAELSDGFREFVLPAESSGDVGFDARQRKHRLLAATTELLRNLASRAPLVVVLEDLHAADAESIEMVDHLARSLLDRPAGTRARVLPVLTLRDEEIGTDHLLERSLLGLADRNLLQRITLERLEPGSTARLLETMTGIASPPPELVAHLQRETEGNPLYAVETIQLLRDEHVLAPRDGRLVFDARRLAELSAMPSGERRTFANGVRETVKRRLVRLSTPALEALQLAAMAGHEISFGLLRAAIGRPEEEVLESLVELLHARVLIEPADRLAIYHFDHEKTREVLLDELTPRARRALAARVARALESSLGERRHDRALELAHLFEDAQEPAKLLEYLPAAAEAAARDGDLGGALRQLRRLLEIAGTGAGSDPSVEMNARRLEARVLLLDGQLDAARGSYQQMLARAEATRRTTDQVEAWNGLSEVAWKTGDFLEARTRAEMAAERAKKLGLRAMEAAALENLGVVFRRTYDVKAASRCLREALRLRRALGDEVGVARILSSLGILFRNQENYELAATHFREAHEVYQQRKDRLGIALTLSHLASVHTRSNEFDEAEKLYHEAGAIDEAMGNRRGVALCREGLGYLHLTRGDYVQARDGFAGALEVFRRIGDRPNMAYSLINLGHTSFRRGSLDEAAAHYREALDLLAAMGNPVIESEARSGLALTLDAAGDKSAALTEAMAAVEVARAKGAREKEAWAQHTLAKVTGSLDEAKKALQLADSVHNENLMLMVHHQMAVLHLAQGQREPAQEHFQRAFTLIDELAGRTGLAKEMFLSKPPVAAVFRDAARM